MARKVDFDPFKIHFTRNQSEEGGGAWRMARKRVKWTYPVHDVIHGELLFLEAK